MLLLILLLMLIGCSCDINVLINGKSGEYEILINNVLWLRSSYVGLYVNNQWYKSNDGSLRLIDQLNSEGNDSILGLWNQTELIYLINNSSLIFNISVRIRQWKSVEGITFYFDNHFNVLTNDRLLSMDDIQTVFPSFFIEKFNQYDQRGYLTFAGMMMGDLEKHANIWDSKKSFIKNGMSSGPIVLFNLTDKGEKDSIIVSPFSQFMTTSLIFNQNRVEYGYIGSIKTIPSNSTNSLIIYYSSKGINHLIEQWGLVMQKYYLRTNEYRLNDLTINNLGYYTDNGGYYYYHTQSNFTYEQTIINIRNEIKLPIHYIQLDSWWYYKGIGNGVKQWIARPDIFPNGFNYLSQKLNSIGLIGHNRYWSSDTIYSPKYHFIIDQMNLKSLPIGNDTFWIDLFNQSSNQWNLILYEQDWLNHQTIDFLPLTEDFHLGRQWLTSMGKGADLFNINIQYCMSLPRHALQALEINRVTQARVSDDYYISIVKKIPQWTIGISSMFSNALGIAPFKDIFWSNETQPNSPYKSKVEEPLPDRQILISTLSTGPVAFADSIDYYDYQRIIRCCRLDGLILKPSKPLTMINLLLADWAFYRGTIQGELYSTKTIINDQIFSIVFASSMRRSYSIEPSNIDSSSGIIWSYDNPYQLSYFDSNHPLHISNKICHSNTFCLWYIAPLWTFNDTLTTKYALMGETDKWTFVSEQRFSNISINPPNTQTTITLHGVSNEILHLLIYHSYYQAIIRLTCYFSPDKLISQIIINSTDLICL